MLENASTDETRTGGSELGARGSDRVGSWHQRYGHLFEELKRPARAMVRRAFGRAFGEDEIEDLYANAWLGTLRALERRRDELGDDELRRYVLTAVANQASKELRRRGRRPTAPLDIARGVPDGSALPDERATDREESQVARDVLATLPPRRRAVLLLRYGWGLAPSEVCGLIQGLSHRAYRKEVTRGVQEVSSKLRAVEDGTWCESREPILQAYVAGVADEEQRRQAEHHLAHCRHCSDYVATLTGHLHEVGTGIGWTGAADVLAGDRVSLTERLSDAADRVRESTLGFLARGGSEPAETTTQIGAGGGARGAGVGAAGGLAKLAGAGGIPKLVAACVGTGAATACVASGVAPIGFPDTSGPAKVERAAELRPDNRARQLPTPRTFPTQVAHEAPAPRPALEDDHAGQAAPDTTVEAAPEPSPAPPIEQEFGLAPAGSATAGSATTATSGSSAGVGGGTDGSGGAVAQEFGP
jgi:RNA polymerase sigma factor (sigma-70 family)